jgi:drug/metabolite transporter (DMT)-like permease
MNWIVLLALSILLKSGGTIFRRRLLGRANSADPYVSAAFFNLSAGIMLMAIALVTGFQAFDIAYLWVWILLNIGAAVIADILQFNALKRIDAGNFAIIESTRVVWTIAVATAFLGEGLAAIQVIGALIILSASTLVLWSQRSKSSQAMTGFVLAGSFAAVYGAATVVDRVLFQMVDVISYLGVALLVQGLVIGLIYRHRMRKVSQLFNRQNAIPFAGDVLFFVPSIVLLLEAVKRTDNVSLLSALLPLSIILSVVLAAVFLRERNHMAHKAAGALLASIGVALLAIS